MDSTYTYPKLRSPLDIRWQKIENELALVLQCPSGVTEEPLFLVPAVAPILQLFEGNLSSEEILNHFAKDGLTREVLNGLIKLLDDKLFLANARFFAAEQGVRDAFHSSTVRPATRAGFVYPAEPKELRKMVEGYLAVPSADSKPDTRELLCLMAPHIDYRRGGRCYGATYPRVAHVQADLFILMGTAHKYSRHIFHLCAKDFGSPLGAFPCDTQFVTRLSHRYGIKRSFADEYLHKNEHSLELQLPFLGVQKPGATIAPILVGSFHHMVAAGKLPHEYEEYDSFVSSLIEAIRLAQQEGKRVCFIAGVDMAHIGRQFGDEGALSEAGMQLIAQRDQQYLAAITKQNKEALFGHVCEDGDARRICGFPTMYTIMDVLERTGNSYQCDVISYDQAVDYKSDCAVTYAGAAMYKQQ
jgi:AmmeMemoRadiSam system protein B